MHVALRTTLPAALAQTLSGGPRRDPAVPIVGLREMDTVFADSIRRPRLLAQLLGAFAGLALLLAVIGTYGVLSFMVAERRREIGIRVAIGASRGSIVAMVTRQGLVIVAIGLVLGLAGALGRTACSRHSCSASGRPIPAPWRASRRRLRASPRWRAESRPGALRGSTQTSSSEEAD